MHAVCRMLGADRAGEADLGEYGGRVTLARARRDKPGERGTGPDPYGAQGVS